MTYESRIAVDLREWTFDLVLDIGSSERRVFTRKIPDHGVLKEYAGGQKRVHVMVGEDKVFIPQEFFQRLLWEIATCKELLRSPDGQRCS